MVYPSATECYSVVPFILRFYKINRSLSCATLRSPVLSPMQASYLDMPDGYHRPFHPLLFRAECSLLPLTSVQSNCPHLLFSCGGFSGLLLYRREVPNSFELDNLICADHVDITLVQQLSQGMSFDVDLHMQTQWVCRSIMPQPPIGDLNDLN